LFLLINELFLLNTMASNEETSWGQLPPDVIGRILLCAVRFDDVNKRRL
jgi:hypothetical protein